MSIRRTLTLVFVPIMVAAAVPLAARASTAADQPAAASSTAPVSPLQRLAGQAAADDLEVTTFNLRYASSSQPNSWAQRRTAMRTLLTTAHPDLIGTQEGLAAQLGDIRSDLGGRYEYIGLGREGGAKGEHMAIFYDTARLTAQLSGNFWLSDTPEVVGSNTWGGGSIRMVTWVRFLDRSTGGRFYAVNTHLDNASEYARQRAATLIAERLAAFDPRLPIVLTGDFNSAAVESNPVYRRLTSGAGYLDSWPAAEVRGPLYGTFTDFKPLVPGGNRIDWIMTSREIAVKAILIDTFDLSGQYPSDHLPVEARLHLPVAA